MKVYQILTEINRRDFLKGAIGAAGAAATSLLPGRAQANDDINNQADTLIHSMEDKGSQIQFILDAIHSDPSLLHDFSTLYDLQRLMNKDDFDRRFKRTYFMVLKTEYARQFQLENTREWKRVAQAARDAGFKVHPMSSTIEWN